MQEAAESDLSEWEFERAAAFRARILLDLGRLDEAELWANSIEPATRPLRSTREIVYQLLIRIELARGRIEDALQLIADAWEFAESSGLRRRLIELSVLSSLASIELGERSLARNHLSRALGLGEVDGYRRVFLDDAATLAPVLKDLQRDRPSNASWSTAYLDEILTEIDGGTKALRTNQSGRCGTTCRTFD